MGTIDFGTTGAASILRARVIRVNAGTFDPVNPMDAVSTTVQQNNTDDPDPAAITTVTDNARMPGYLPLFTQATPMMPNQGRHRQVIRWTAKTKVRVNLL
jgi:hypothetical protein